jgi:hypothetical protein
MPFKLSVLDSATSGISGALHSTADAGTSSSVQVLHNGLPAHLVSAVLGGSLAPVAAAAVLLAVGGVQVLRSRPALALRTLPV